jgi:formyl-CoA transferase
MQNSFPKLSGTPSAIRTLAAETVGKDNADVYGELLGLDAALSFSSASASVI